MTRLAAAVIVSLTLASGGVFGGVSAARATTVAQPACGNDLETWFAPQGNGYAGGAGYVVEFSNIGRTACRVRGYPTVMLTKNGRRVGQKSRHLATVPVRTVTLYPGQTAHVVLLITDAGVLCRPTPTNGLSVKPPGIPAARLFSFAGSACPAKSTLRVDAINPGVGIPFYTIR